MSSVRVVSPGGAPAQYSASLSALTVALESARNYRRRCSFSICAN